MFRPDPRLDHIPAARSEVVSIIEAINQPTVGVPGHAPQSVRAWVVGARRPEGGLGLWIHLLLVESGEAVIYASDRGRLGVDEYGEVELEALAFVESMGFMVDNLNFRHLPEAAQAEIYERLPCFFPPDRPAEGPRVSPPGETEVLGIDEDLETLEPDERPPAAELDEADVVEADVDEVRPGRLPLDPEQLARVGRILGSF